MIKYKKIKIGNKFLTAVSFKLGKNNLIVLRGSKGYVMCGYLNLKAAEKFKEAAIKITGVSTIAQAIKTMVVARTSAAKKMGIEKGQPVIEVLKKIV